MLPIGSWERWSHELPAGWESDRASGAWRHGDARERRTMPSAHQRTATSLYARLSGSGWRLRRSVSRPVVRGRLLCYGHQEDGLKRALVLWRWFSSSRMHFFPAPHRRAETGTEDTAAVTVDGGGLAPSSVASRSARSRSPQPRSGPSARWRPRPAPSHRSCMRSRRMPHPCTRSRRMPHPSTRRRRRTRPCRSPAPNSAPGYSARPTDSASAAPALREKSLPERQVRAYGDGFSSRGNGLGTPRRRPPRSPRSRRPLRETGDALGAMFAVSRLERLEPVGVSARRAAGAEGDERRRTSGASRSAPADASSRAANRGGEETVADEATKAAA